MNALCGGKKKRASRFDLLLEWPTFDLLVVDYVFFCSFLDIGKDKILNIWWYIISFYQSESHINGYHFDPFFLNETHESQNVASKQLQQYIRIW